MRAFLMHLLYHLLLIRIIYGGGVPNGLKWVRVNLPQYRKPGEQAQLQCDYDLGNDTLYAVKWYKEHEEFYRFVPKARPQANSYKVEGVHVDIDMMQLPPFQAVNFLNKKPENFESSLKILVVIGGGTTTEYIQKLRAALPKTIVLLGYATTETGLIFNPLPPTSMKKPQSIGFPLPNNSAKMNLSDNKKVVLRSVNLKTSGLYKCEVSAEAPSFASAQSEARMEVVSLPKEDPTITGVEIQYQIGDEINLNCTSGKSHPASILHWYINEQQVVSSGALIRYPPIQHRHGLVTTTLGLRFVLSSRHFLGGSMRVKCVASVSPVLWRGDRESVVQSLPIQDMREALLLVKSSASEMNASSLAVAITLLFMLIT